MDRTEITVIGAGVVGLAVAGRLSEKHPSLVITEKRESFGCETSSRNSEVIHSGIYYPKGSLKQRLCVRGNPLLYEYLRARGIAHRPTGKLVVAVSENERESLAALKTNGEKNGVAGLRLLTGAEARSFSPSVSAAYALYVPSAGILDTHALMASLLEDAKRNGATAAFNSGICAINKVRHGYRLRINGSGYEFETKYVVNCAGLYAADVAAFCGLDTVSAGYSTYYCKGQYFRSARPCEITLPVYPAPEAELHSLGIHITPDLAGSLRFGPDATYVDSVEYNVDENKKTAFAEAVRKYFPGINIGDLFADTAGVRPKLQAPGGGFRDFEINEESTRGFPGLVNLAGIESPGLTSCLAIAELVEELIDNKLSSR